MLQELICPDLEIQSAACYLALDGEQARPFKIFGELPEMEIKLDPLEG